MLKKSIVLIGFMGSGKTTLGKLLSEKLSLPLVDCDTIIEHQEKQKISKIFELKGEDYFRDKESELLLTLSLAKPSVISTGGGCVTVAQNHVALKRLGLVVYLHCDENELINRLESSDTSRPLNKSADYLRYLFSQRLPLYRQVADLEVDTTNETVSSALSTLLNALESV